MPTSSAYTSAVPPSTVPHILTRESSRSAAGIPPSSRSAPGSDPQPPMSYGHHRQTSIVHGYQHSRNASFVNSPATSPLSPQVISAAGASFDAGSDVPPTPGLPEKAEPSPGSMPVNGANGTMMAPAPPSLGNGDRGVPDSSGGPGGPQRRMERMHSGGKIRREQSHHHSSHSRHHHQPELKTVGEYALHHLFNSFLGQADQKIDQCITNALGPEPNVEEICGPGVDPNFDQLISALGHIARQKPKPLIDTLMHWRKSKSETASVARTEAAHSHRSGPSTNGLLPRRNTEPTHGPSDSTGSAMNAANPTSPASSASRQEAIIQAERRATVAIYLLCRVLMEILGQSTLACVTPEMADKLEDIIFGQLKAADPEQLAVSPLKMANWSIFAQLLGVMSGLNLESVSDRFFKELEKLQREQAMKTIANKDVEGKTELVVLGMKHLRLGLSPQDAWDRSCEVMQNLGRFYANSHGQRIKHAYCRILTHLLLPIAATIGPELNAPKWRAFVDSVTTKVQEMLLKPRHWQDAFPLMAVLLCVSAPEVFHNSWLHMLSPLHSKLKDRTTRGTTLQAVCRLLWTYLYRMTDSPTNVARKLEEVIRLVLPPGKKTYLSTDTTIAEPLIQLIRMIGYKQQDFCFRTIIFPMINSDLFTSGRELKAEQLEPEKMVIGIRAFLAIMSDLERGNQGRPPFPESFSSVSLFSRPSPASPSLVSKTLATPARGTSRDDRLSRPVITANFNDAAREYYKRFCEILGKITMICDDAFGGQAALDEKFGSLTPKTPMAETFSFGRRDEHQGGTDQRQGFYELLHVAVQALPRCLSPDLPFNSIVNLLCTGTAHVQKNIAASSAQSLKSIARQAHAQQVTIGFARFIFNFDDRYATMSEGGMLGPLHIEYTLKLYVELLQIWIEEIKQKSKDATLGSPDDGPSGRRGAQLDLSGIQVYVDEVESHGLFFLCSQSRRVRSFAVTVLRLITEFDVALEKENTRIIHIMERESLAVMDFNDESLSVAERSRLQRGMRKNNSHNTLMELCGSDISYDSTLWFKIFPNLVKISFERCPFATTLGREIVCTRLLQMHKAISALAETTRGPQYPALDMMPGRAGPRLSTTPPEVMIEQWKLYLIVACTTLTNTGTHQQAPTPTAQHARKGSRPAQQGQEKVASARALFHQVIPLLSVGPSSIREAVVVALGSINLELYKTLLESLQSTVAMCNEEARQRIHQRTASSPRRSRRTDRLRTEITHVYKLTSHFLREERAFSDDSVLQNLVTYTNDLKIFLSDAEVQNDWEFQKLRRHYCGLMEELFEGINRTRDPARWMPFEARKSAFALMEDWCGYSPNQNQIRQREDTMRQSVIDQQRDVGDKGTVTAAMEIEKRNLKTAALSAMAALCGGPVSVTTERKANLQFDVRRMLSWINAIFSTPSDRLHTIGRRALKNLIVHNEEHPYLLERSIQMCYLSEAPKALESYFDVVSQVLLENANYPMAFWKVLGAGLFTLGNEKSEIRSKAAHLLRTLEERQQKNSKIQDYEISISDKTTAVYKLAQFEMSRRLAKQHSELAFLIFSEFSIYFKSLEAHHQRSMVAAILPWIQAVELQVDPNGGPTAHSYMLLANLFEITINSSGLLHNEVQALWQALATGPHGGNVQLVLNFIISLCLDKREQNFVDYAKQIVVFMSSTPAGLKVVEFLLLKINPKAMVQEKREPLMPPPDAVNLPYLADLSLALPIGNKQAGFSLGQLSLVLLVDLMVSPVQLAPESVPLLLQVVFVLWDHYISLVQEQAREMLIHLIHELVISKIDDKSTVPAKKTAEDLIESIRRHDPRVIWTYDDSNGKEHSEGTRVPDSMGYLAAQVLDVFAIAYPRIREQWGKVTLSWATSCPVRHLACRSFQIFRCILTSLDQSMLSDMLARLSNTIADEDPDIQNFSMEILTTLKTIIGALDPSDLLQYPQLFWTTCACLNTINEREFIEGLAMLENFMDKVDLTRPEYIQLLADNVPVKWEGNFEGIQPLIYRGLRSVMSLDRTLAVLEKLSVLPYNQLIGDDGRLLFAVLANLPRFLHSMDSDSTDLECIACADKLAKVADAQGHDAISRSLKLFANSGSITSNDFLRQSAAAIRDSFLPGWDFKSLVFLMGLLTNQLPWFKIKTMQLLCVFIPEIDMRKPEIASHGPDLISPLLRLLQTEFCPQALEVLDHIMAMPGTPMDKHHIRMSMAGSHSRAIRKEYERTQSLFGIPEDTGWSIPMPAVYSTTTRSNVHAVFYTCANSESADAGEAAVTPDVDFHADDFQYGYPFPDRTATMMSDEIRGDGNMGDLVMKLDSLDDFFDDNMIQNPAIGPKSPDSITHYYADSTDAGARYDQQTLPLLRKSLTRTASVTSFKSGFADSRNREPVTMSPTAFAIPPVPSTRPPMHARSITSPAVNNGHAYAGGDFLSDEDGDEVFSDDEYRTQTTGDAPDGNFSFGSMIRPLAHSTRSGMRRLTGGAGKDKERLRDTIRAEKRAGMPLKSPKVPKVPASYIRSPQLPEANHAPPPPRVLCAASGDDLVAVFGLEDSLRPDVGAVVSELVRRGIAVSMVSGDDAGAVNSTAATLGLPAARVRSRCSPADKQRYVEDLVGRGRGVVMFCGDGTNDAVALAQAGVGVCT
ncbi:MAG: Cell morphogenesis protein PAG1 [Thelocarpon impressellum]|nr:MAG: Cell morphogenesis protein PAG1 [Thelocarpon impressellum]